MAGDLYTKPGPKSIPINPLSLKALIHLRGYTQQELADEMGIGVRTIQGWLYGEKHPSERYFVKLCNTLKVPPIQLTAHSKEIRDRARHERVMKFYHAEMLDELALADYREVQLIQADIDTTAEFDPSGDETKELDITVSSAGESSAHPKSDDENGDRN